jgi:putative ABC transport system ATP-binding protein
MFIRIEDLHKEYTLGQQRVRALNGVGLNIAAGEFLAIMGASGSGKSTLLNAIGGLDHPSDGHIWVGNDDLTTPNEPALCAYRRRHVGFVFQKFNLLNAQTALENVEFPLVFAGVPEKERRTRSKTALESVGLGDRLQHRPSELSGGQQQRVAIARAIVHNPDILLADEPTGNLDSHTSAEILELLNHLNQQGHTLLMVTHDERIAAHAGRTIQMQDGQVVNPSP